MPEVRGVVGDLATGAPLGSAAVFLLGDRKLGAWVISLSERASGESAWLLVGLPGAAYTLGFLELWTAIGCTTGIFLSWTLVAGRLHPRAPHFRLFLDFLRATPLEGGDVRYGGLTPAQWASILMVGVGLAVWQLAVKPHNAKTAAST